MPKAQLASDEAFLKAIDKHWKMYYAPPTVRWLMKELGYHTICSVSLRLNRLGAEGIIQFENAHAIPYWVIRAINEAEAK